MVKIDMEELSQSSPGHAGGSSRDSEPDTTPGQQARRAASGKDAGAAGQGRTGKKCVFQNWQKDILKKWFISHVDHPYLNEKSKLKLMQQTGLESKKISNWFMNVRKRIWQPVMKKNKNKSKCLFRIVADTLL